MENQVEGSLGGRYKTFFAAVFLQVEFAVMDILFTTALNLGMSIATLVMAPFAAFLDRKMRPKMTMRVFIQIMVP
ncbi:hypothetical protein ES319_D09G172800v1 [Gossypium barbadense]|uniref:WAT1-related protein n=2 Tax=Gossypium TaxID=3633 RepID=A0A5J5Q435_GOSBA|nr:hypothetical protein ES319_D09G172800v1 [Gossypium barbadense]TYG54430.1 hypothetical protein ES288_D09G189200v1 [Gossypium darwinii]